MVCLLTFEAPFGIDAQGDTAVPSDDDEAKNFEIGGDGDSGEDGVKVAHALGITGDSADTGITGIKVG